MERYVSYKEVEAEPMDRFTAQKSGLVRDIVESNEHGYKVVYADGYESWSPKDAFENGYKLKEK